MHFCCMYECCMFNMYVYLCTVRFFVSLFFFFNLKSSFTNHNSPEWIFLHYWCVSLYISCYDFTHYYSRFCQWDLFLEIKQLHGSVHVPWGLRNVLKKIWYCLHSSTLYLKLWNIYLWMQSLDSVSTESFYLYFS